MKAKRRQELQTNALADWLGKQIDVVRPYTTWIVGGLIALALAVVVLSMRSARQSAEATEGWNELQQATTAAFNALQANQPLPLNNALQQLQTIAEGYGSRPVGTYARLAMGDVHMSNGESQFRTNKSAAREQFKHAATQYDAVVGSAKDPQVQNRAIFCLAKSYEWQGKFEKAKEYYGQVERPFRKEAQQRLDSLSQPGTFAFYEQLADWKPKPPPLPGADRYPGLNLDQDTPPAEGEFDFERYLDATAAGVDLVPDVPAPDDPTSTSTEAPDNGEPAEVPAEDATAEETEPAGQPDANDEAASDNPDAAEEAAPVE